MTDKKDGREHVAVPLDEATVARLDALQAHLSGPALAATRSDTLRALLLTALSDAEQDPERFVERWRALENS